MTMTHRNDKKYYWVVREWFNETMQKMSKQSRGFPDYYFRHSMKDVFTNPEYTEIYSGTQEQITMLVGLRDYYYDHPEVREKLRNETYAEMERVK